MDSQGKCAYDSMGILNSPDGPGGRLCGDKSGYSTLTSVRRMGDTELGLSVVVQEPNYLWNVKITQISCDEVTFLFVYGKLLLSYYYENF